MSWLSENSVDYDLLNYLLIFISCKMICNHLLQKKKKNQTFSFMPGHVRIHTEQLVNSHIPFRRLCLAALSVVWMSSIKRLCFRRSGWRGEDYVCKGPAVPNPALVHWNFKKAQTARALGCLSSHCLLNHWRAIGLSMHEKVLSTSTLQKALKKNFNIQTSTTPLDASPRIQVYFCELQGCFCVSDLTAPVSVKPTTQRYYSHVTA